MLYITGLLLTGPTTRLGTNLKYYIEEGGTFNDITPIRTGSTSAGVITFAATTSAPFSSTITVTHVNHGAAADFVTTPAPQVLAET